MNPILRTAFEQQLATARDLLRRGEYQQSVVHLERAHVLGQAHVVPHTRSHWLMLLVELRRRRPAAIVGQALRLVLGALGSAIGVVPVGNTGGTDISMFKRLPIPPELQRIIDGKASADSPTTPGS